MSVHVSHIACKQVYVGTLDVSAMDLCARVYMDIACKLVHVCACACVCVCVYMCENPLVKQQYNHVKMS